MPQFFYVFPHSHCNYFLVRIYISFWGELHSEFQCYKTILSWALNYLNVKFVQCSLFALTNTKYQTVGLQLLVATIHCFRFDCRKKKPFAKHRKHRTPNEYCDMNVLKIHMLSPRFISSGYIFSSCSRSVDPLHYFFTTHVNVQL